MDTAIIKSRLHNYLEFAGDKKIKAIYTMVEEEINKQNEFNLSEEEIHILDEERKNHLNGKSQSFTWETAKKMIRNKNMQ